MRYARVARARDDRIGDTLVVIVLAMVALLMLAALAPAQSVAPQPTTTYVANQGVKLTGVIVSRQGDDLLVRDADTRQISQVSIVPATRISSPTGFLHLDRKSQDATQLIPGLIVVVHGSGGENGNLIAHRISFRKSAERVATQISAGEVELKARQDEAADSMARARTYRDSSLNAINTRVTDLDAYDLKDVAVVTFATGSAELGSTARAALSDIVTRNRGLSGYLVEVSGHADATGDADMNQRLSQRRADAVVAYLTQVSAIPIRRITNPTGLGTAQPAATNETAAGRARNRRAEVRVLVNRGVVQPDATQP